MMDKLKKNMVFYLLLLIDFYIVPWFIKNTGSAMIVMLVIIPLICLITSVFYGIRNGFNFWYILIVAIMFAPSIFIFYNSRERVRESSLATNLVFSRVCEEFDN